MEALQPKLRFHAFKDDWILKKLNEISKIYDGTHQTPEYVDLGVPFYSVEHVTANQFESTKFISEDVFEKENKRVKLEKGDILMTRIGSIGVTKYIDWDVNASFYVSLALLKIKKNYNSEFVNHFISSPFFQSELWKRTIHVAFPQKINLGEIGDCMVILPSIEEQLKIANFLSLVDKKINLQTRKKTLLEKYKKGIMQKIFNQEIRFKDDNGNEYPEWNEETLDNIATINMGQSPSSNSYNVDGNGLLLIQGNADIKERKTNPRQWTSQPTKKCEIGDIILTVRAPVGFVSKSIHEACIGRGVCSIKSKGKNNNEFVYQFLLYFEDKWGKLEQGSTFTAVSGTEIKSILLEVPSFQEQDNIATFLSSIDCKINSVIIQLENTKKFKKGLLQQMFVK
jgi:type I restriction enzyme S subunit